MAASFNLSHTPSQAFSVKLTNNSTSKCPDSSDINSDIDDAVDSGQVLKRRKHQINNKISGKGINFGKVYTAKQRKGLKRKNNAKIEFKPSKKR